MSQTSGKEGARAHRLRDPFRSVIANLRYRGRCGSSMPKRMFIQNCGNRSSQTSGKEGAVAHRRRNPLGDRKPLAERAQKFVDLRDYVHLNFTGQIWTSNSNW